MKKSSIQAHRVAVLLLLIPFAAGAEEEARRWTLDDGTSVTGAFVEAHEHVVVLRREGGGRMTLATQRLSPADRLWMAEHEGSEQGRREALEAALPASLRDSVRMMDEQARRLKTLFEAKRLNDEQYQASRASLIQSFWTRFYDAAGTNAAPEIVQSASEFLSCTGW